ncbi:hypothetical protein [Ottowia sp.]|uniref:hypothetical protein n=1 Tax=Ottowia sp. TaxID=1898956 RepID=UPI003A86E365
MGQKNKSRGLLALIGPLMRRLGWRFKQSGNGTQIGQVGGGVTINHYHPSAHHDAASDVLALLDALEPYGKREAMLDWMEGKFGTRWVVKLDDVALRRIWGYARTTLGRARWTERQKNAKRSRSI